MLKICGLIFGLVCISGIFITFISDIFFMKIYILSLIISSIVVILFLLIKLKINKNKLIQKNEEIRNLQKLKVEQSEKIAKVTENYFNKIAKSIDMLNSKNNFNYSIFNNILTNVYVVNKDGIIIAVNDELLKNLKINEQDILGKSYDILSNIEHKRLEKVFKEGKIRNINNKEETIIINNKKIQILKSISFIQGEEKKLVSAIISFVDINKIKLLEEKLLLSNKQLSYDLKMARRVQQKIIPDPKQLSGIEKLRFGYAYSSMEIMGGDFYDLIKISDNKYAFFIADVSGHGAAASLITAMIKVSFLTHTKEYTNPTEILSMVNDDMFKIIGGTGYFVSAYYCIIDTNTGLLQYTNGGHFPAILYRKEQNSIEELQTQGTLLGVFESKYIEYETKSITIEEGDKILLYTDGIIEANNSNNEFYKRSKLMKFIERNCSLHSDELVKALIKDIERFSNGEKQTDDRAVFCIEYNTDMDLSIDFPIEKPKVILNEKK